MVDLLPSLPNRLISPSRVPTHFYESSLALASCPWGEILIESNYFVLEKFDYIIIYVEVKE